MQRASPMQGDGVAGDEVDRDAKLGRTGTQHLDIAQHRHAAGQRLLRQRDAQVGADAGRLARSEGEDGWIHCFTHP